MFGFEHRVWFGIDLRHKLGEDLRAQMDSTLKGLLHLALYRRLLRTQEGALDHYLYQMIRELDWE